MNRRHDDTTAYGFFIREKNANWIAMMKPHWLSLLCGCVLLLLTNVLVAYLPVFINAGVVIITNGLPFTLQLFSHSFRLEFFELISVIVIVAIVGAILRTYSRRVLFDVGRTVERDLRMRLFFHLSILDDQFFAKHPVGDAMNRLTTDMANIRMMAGFAVLNLLNIAFVFIFTVPLLMRIDWLLALCALTPFPLIILATSGIVRNMFYRTIDYQKQLSELISHVQENLLGAHIVRLFHQQDQENKRYIATNKATFDAGVRLARVRIFMLPIMRLMVGISVGLVLFVGGSEVASGRITIGDFVEINARILQLAWPAMSVGFVMSIVSRAQASLMRINQMLDYVPAIKDGTQRFSQLQRINVRDLSLSADSQGQNAKISFSLECGQMLAVVGPSGSYKSTLLKILSRRKIIPSGTVFIDDHDVSDSNLSDFYDNMSVVPEESFLFHKTIRENICFAQPDASAQNIDDVIKLLRLDRDIAGFTLGLDTMVGDRGVTLSGGQRQRVALARALIAKRPVLILDDALSAVDAETEAHIVKNLRDYVADVIVIIATHRLSAVRNADEILVLEHGTLHSRGKHEDLLTSSTLYQQLWGIDQQAEKLS